jgi:alpha-L-fucosidase
MTRRSAILACAAAAAVRGATRPVPTREQAAWQDFEIGMFIHFAPNTYNNTQGDLGGMSDPRRFTPHQLDVAQWLDVAQSMNARYVVLVAKHVGGFCLWPTRTTLYSIASTPYKGGKGDIVGEFAAECRKRNMPYGFYISPRDDHRGVREGGIARSGMPEDQRRYDEVYKQQLTELLTGYGKLAEVWFDGSANGELVRPLIRAHQPQAMIFQSSAATIRWVGNEEGVAPYPVWNTVREHDWGTGEAKGAGVPDGDIWLPAECDVPIRKDWFWTTDNHTSLKTLEQLMDIYCKSVGRGCNLLLNHTPDRTGLIPAGDAARAAEFGSEIRRRFGKSVAETTGAGATLELSLSSPAVIDHAIVAEDILSGQRVREYRIEVRDGASWRTVATGTSIGHKRIDSFEPTRTSALRITATRYSEEPRWRKFSAGGGVRE